MGIKIGDSRNVNKFKKIEVKIIFRKISSNPKSQAMIEDKTIK